MSASRKRHIWIGAFVVGALIVLAIGVAVMGGGLGRGKLQAVMVFRGNVTGLDTGTPVVFRGMKVGEVRKVRTIYDPNDKTVLFPVYAEFTGTIEVPGYAVKTDRRVRTAWIDDMIGHGLRAQLQTRSFVTGQQMVMLDFFDGDEAVYAHPEDGVLEIPTVRSPSEAIFDTIRELPVRELIVDGEKLLANLNALLAPGGGPESATIPGLLARMNKLAGSLEKQLPDTTREFAATARDMRGLLADARKALGSIDEATRTLQRQAERSGGAFESTAKEFESLARTAQGSAGDLTRALARMEASLGRIDQALARVDHTLSEDSPIGAGLTGTLGEVTAAAQSLRQAIEGLNRRPDSLLFGRRPENR